MNKCSLCNGDGKKLVPIKNVNMLTLDTHAGVVTPDYFTRIEACKCVNAQHEKEPITE